MILTSRRFVLYLILACAAAARAAPSGLTQTQTKLKQADKKIVLLQQQLTTTQDKHGLVNKKLAHTEKQIGSCVLALNNLKLQLSGQQQKMAQLKSTTDALTQKLQHQQELLATYVRARYQIGEYQPLKWLLNQDDPYSLNRIMTYYQYVIGAQEHLISEIAQNKNTLHEHQTSLQQELQKHQQLQQELNTQQQQLQINKHHQTELIRSLDHDIANQRNDLQEAQRNKEHLARLLNSLNQQSTKPRFFSFTRKKLPYPLQTKTTRFQKMNQGLTFFAEEGAKVTAVSSGKVVFSDWLKGYGLLLIIDHGQGFMTLYAHNQALFKHKGSLVSMGEQIATVGHTGGIKQSGLYFEIRVRGKAVPPLQWLS